MALRAANGPILRVAVFSLGTQTLSLLPVPRVKDQPVDPCRVHIHQQSPEHQWQQQARDGGEAHVRPAVASHSPIRAQAVATVTADRGDSRYRPRRSRVRRSQVEPEGWARELRVEPGAENHGLVPGNLKPGRPALEPEFGELRKVKPRGGERRWELSDTSTQIKDKVFYETNLQSSVTF